MFGAPAGRPAAVGTAEISGPQPGQALRGVVLILGTADHPAFDHYEVSFAYEPTPTAVWFAIEAAGVLVGIEPDGALQLRTDGGQILTLNSGSLRRSG